MWRSVLALAVGLAVLLPSSASAQFTPQGSEPAWGESFVVEFGAFYWNPTPELVVRTETLNILGSAIDLVDDLGVERKRLPDLRFVLRPARKHKFRVAYSPIEYTTESVLRRSIVFNGTTYQVGIPVNSVFEWKTWRFGYEYDFVARERGYVGVIADVKYTQVEMAIASPLRAETVKATAPIPSIGGTFRVYPVPMVALTGEVTGVRLPGSLTDGDETADYLDWDLYATVNFGRHVGAQVGYRTLDVSFRYDEEFGDMKMKGPYFGGVVRF
ncbi:MAG: hypothetical protein AB7I50_24505 [Vicinamibacterales bacterium]